MTRASRVHCLACWLTSLFHLVLQLHVVHYNSDRYRSFAEAKDKPDGLAVLAFLFEVLGKVSHVFVSALFKALLFHTGRPGRVHQHRMAATFLIYDCDFCWRKFTGKVLGETISKAFEVTAILLLESASWVQKISKGSFLSLASERTLVPIGVLWILVGKGHHCSYRTVGILLGWDPVGLSSQLTDKLNFMI